jgi:hypothetical protein
MAQINWIGGSGSWGQASNWGGTLPGNTDQVYIDVPGVTVTVGSGVAAAAQTLNTDGATLDIDGGSLFTVQDALFQGAFEQSSGTYTMSGLGAVFDESFSSTGGKINDLSGAITLNDGGILAGTITGAGALQISQGDAYVDSGFSAGIASIVVGANGGKLGFNINFTYAKNFTLLQNGVLDMFGHTLTLTGQATLDGTVSNGTVIAPNKTTPLTLGNPNVTTTLDNGLVLEVKGAAVQLGNIALGANDSGAKITVTSAGTYQIDGNWSLTNPASVASISNAGTFAKAFGAKTSVVSANFTNAASGTLAVDVGTLLLNGMVNTLNGTVSGAGTLGIAGDQTTLGAKVALNVAAIDQQSGVLVLNKPLTYSGIWDLSGGVTNLNATSAKLTLTGPADLDGGTLTGFGGSVTFDGATNLQAVTIGGPITLNVKGTVDQTGSITFGESSNPTVNIESGATWTLEGDSAIVGFFGLIDNSGSFIDSNGSGDAIVQAELANGGVLEVNNSTLTLAGENFLGGTLSGTGLLDLSGVTTLDKGLTISVAELSVDNNATFLNANESFAGAFSENGNNGALVLDGFNLALTGTAAFDSGAVAGGGDLSTSGATVLGNYAISDGSVMTIGGTAEQSGFVNLTGGTLSIGAHASYTIDDDLNIYVNSAAGSLVNAGVLTASGTGTSQIGAAFTNTGSLVVSNQLLQLGGGGTLSGNISGAGTLELNSFSGGSDYQLEGSANLANASLWIGNEATLTLAGKATYAGLFELNNGEIALTGQTLSLTGTTSVSSGLVVGPGVLDVSGSGTLGDMAISAGATLLVTGSTEQTSNLSVGDSPNTSTSELSIAAGATYTLDANASITNNGTLLVAGTLAASGDGTGTITTAIVDTGLITANLGTLEIISTVGGSGVLGIGKSGLLELSNTATISASNFASFTTGGGELIIGNEPKFGATIENFSAQDVIGLVGFNGATLGDSYANNQHTEVTFSDQSGDSITLTFSTAQTLSNFTLGTDHNGLATITHN